LVGVAYTQPRVGTAAVGYDRRSADTQNPANALSCVAGQRITADESLSRRKPGITTREALSDLLCQRTIVATKIRGRERTRR
jgi:hypothetical protein